MDSNITKLYQYEGLFERVVQWWFWECYRPDIVNESRALIPPSGIKLSTSAIKLRDMESSISTLSRIGWDTIFYLIEVARGTDNAKRMLGDIGSVPIVSRAYDPNCKVSLVGGIIRQMKKSGDRAKYFQALTLFVNCADCVDKDVITEMIDYGCNFTSDYDDANVATQLICSMITRKKEDGSQQPNDSRTAFAIRAGLLEYCTSMIARFGGDKNARDIMGNVSSILQIVYFLSFHKKTSKAIGAKRRHLISERERLKENQQVANERSNECNRALSIIQSIIAITSTNCFVCNKETERKDMKKCAACRSVCYCSEECQKKDWQSGCHDCNCNNIIDGYHQVLLPEFRDNNEKETAKLKGLERNILMAQKQLYLEHAETIGEQLAAKEPPSSEYIVHFNLSQCPLAVTVMAYTEYFDSCDSRKWFEENMQSDDKNIMCVYESPFFNGHSNELGYPESLTVYNLFPLEWLSSDA